VAATPKKQAANKDSPTTAAPKKTKEPAKVTKLVRDKTATLPVTVTFQGDNAEAKHTSKAGYTHALKLDATGPFTLLDSVSRSPALPQVAHLTTPSTSSPRDSNMRDSKSSSSSQPRLLSS
jgi:hypothetical protein